MRFSALQGAAAGAVVTGAAIALIVRPPMLAPRAAATPGLDFPAAVTASASRSKPPPPAPENAVVYVAGAVAHPGVYALRADARAVDAVARAGGLTRDADVVAVNLAAHVADGDEIAVPRIGDSATRATAQHHARGRSGKGTHRRRHRRPAADSDSVAAAPGTIDLNSAGESVLATVPGIGATLASRIVAFRAINGPFASVDGLADVSGITPSRFDAIAPFLTVGRP